MTVRLLILARRPIELNILVPNPDQPMGWRATLDFVSEAAEAGVRLHPMFTTNALGLHLRLSDTFVFDEMPGLGDFRHR